MQRLILRISKGLLIATAFSVLALLALSEPVPSFTEVKASYLVSDIPVLDRNGAVIDELRVDDTRRRLPWVPLGEIAETVKSAVINLEDRRFYSGGLFRFLGVDFYSLAGAVLRGVEGLRFRGASTIPMQLAAALTTPSTAHSRSVFRKLKQIATTFRLSLTWTRPEALEGYLNLVTFRGELQGIHAASRGLFNKDPHGLSTEEGTYLAALIRNPNAPAEVIVNRACHFLKTENCEQSLTRIVPALGTGYQITRRESLTPHVTRTFAREATKSRPNEIRTTIDASLQRVAMQALSQQLTPLREQGVRDGAVIVIKNDTGEVLAYVGNSGEGASKFYVDGVKAKRQAGSTLKPFLYGLALDKKIVTASTLVDDSPVDIPLFGGVFRPRNYDHDFHGPVSVRMALGSSLNVPAVRTLGLVGVEDFVATLTGFGFSELKGPDYYGFSLALGSAGVSLLELANGYRALANGGEFSPARLTPASVAAPVRIISPEAAFIVSDILSDRESRSITFGFENPLATSFWAAAKTGTSRDMVDNWCVGYSRNYTVGVWVGNFSGEPMRDVSGVTGAAPVWLQVLSYLEGARPQDKAVMHPEGVLQVAVEQGRNEWFIRGTEPPSFDAESPTQAIASPRIIYPVQGMIIALDPDIPEDNQRVVFKATGVGQDVMWVLDGETQTTASSPYIWSPISGKHMLALKDLGGLRKHQVNFEVRGRLKSERFSD